MSAQPIWITPPGSLGTIPEGAFYQVPLQVTEPDGSPVYFQVIAGALPSGVECTADGIIQGVPTNIVTVAEETVVVGANVTSKFAVRAYTTKVINNVKVINRLADRTFTITIVGQNNAEWITPPGPIGEFFAGELLLPGIQLEYTTNPLSIVKPVVSLVSGSLPPGVSISSTGLISGFVGANTSTGVLAGYSRDGQGFDEYGFDFDTNSPSYNYAFTLKVTDGITTSLQNFSMYVWSTSVFVASTTLITGDNSYLTASISNAQIPVILNPQGNIGTVPNSTYFAYQFTAENLSNDNMTYVGTFLPPGLTLDPVSGWLYGYLSNVGLSEVNYNFYVRAYQTNDPTSVSKQYSYNLTVTGPISTNVTWLTPPNLGTISNGSTSLFYVAAETTSNLPLQYKLLSGSNSKLPQGLTLLPSGHIVGRVSFNTFALDDGTTTFDNNATTFDSVYTFTVNASSINGYVNVNNTFSITVVRTYDKPYNNLYIKCMPPQPSRNLISTLLENSSIFTPSLLYRSDDPNFGLSKDVVYYHAYGLNALNIDFYVSALELNHYWKNLTLGEIKTAQAVDPLTGKVLYEVVYSEVIDDLVNNQGVSVGKEVILPYPLNATGSSLELVDWNNSSDQTTPWIDQASVLTDWTNGQANPLARSQVISTPVVTQWLNHSNQPTQWINEINSLTYWTDGSVVQQIDEVYPNALVDMRNQVIDVVGQESDMLPLWMLSTQSDGSVLGFTPAWVIAYTNPGASGQIAYNIQTQFGNQLNLVNFEADRYELDNSLTVNWDSDNQEWIPTPPQATTFDVNYNYNAELQSSGIGYHIGDTITINGVSLGGSIPENNLVITVTHVSNYGSILEYTAEGTASIIANGNTYYGLTGTTSDGGSGAVWNVDIVPGYGAPLEITDLQWINSSNLIVPWINNENSITYWSNGTVIDTIFDTRFDGGSMTFNTPADLDTNTDAYDRYLLFPKRNILQPLLTFNSLTLVNDNNESLGWANDSGNTIIWVTE